MTDRTDELKWNRPIEQDWPKESSNVRVVAGAHVSPVDVTPVVPTEWDAPSAVVEPTERPAPAAPHEQVRQQILDQAADHIDKALDHLTQAVDWFGVIDPASRAGLVDPVAAFAETIHYRRQVASE